MKYKKWVIIVLTMVGMIFLIKKVWLDPFLDKDLIASPIAEFDPNPGGKSTGFVSINDEECAYGCTNTFDEITIRDLYDGDIYHFTVYIAFRNKGKAPINGASVKLYLSEKDGDGSYVFTAELSGDNVNSIFDKTRVIGIANGVDLKLERVKLANNHGDIFPEECNGYNYSIILENPDDIFEKGVSLDVLDAKHGGWCDQGYIFANFSLSKK